jgi:hypothetical protein
VLASSLKLIDRNPECIKPELVDFVEATPSLKTLELEIGSDDFVDQDAKGKICRLLESRGGRLILESEFSPALG